MGLGHNVPKISIWGHIIHLIMINILKSISVYAVGFVITGNIFGMWASIVETLFLFLGEHA